MVSAYEGPLEAINTEIDMAVKELQMSEAERLFNTIFEQNMLPNTYSYRCMIHGYRKINKPNEALAFYEKMVQAGVEVDQKTYHTLITVCAITKKLDEAFIFFKKMQAAGFTPNTISFNCMLNVCAKTKSLIEAKELFYTIPQEARDQSTYLALLQVCQATRNRKEEEKIKHQMKSIKGLS